jgi:MFS family permease
MTSGRALSKPSMDELKNSRQPSSPWRQARFRWFFAGQSISVMGSAISPVALSFAVLNVSNSTGALALVLVAQTVPLLVFLVVGGAISDKISRSVVLIFSNLGAGLTQGAVGALLITGNYHLDVIVTLEIVNGSFAAFTTPALRAIVPELVERHAQQRANSAIASSKSLASILGPSLGGVLVVTIGGGWAIAIDGASYLIAVICMTQIGVTASSPSGRSNLLVSIREGWSEFIALPWVVVMVLVYTFTNCILAGVWVVLGPVIARHTIGESAWGVVLSARAIGLLIMYSVMYRFTTRYLLRIGQACASLFAIPLIVLGLRMPVGWLIGAALIGGLGAAVANVAWDTSLQEHVSPQVLSRVSSYDNLGSYIGVPIGQLAVVPIAAVIGQDQVAVIGGILFAAISLLALASSSVRSLEHAV